MSPRFRSEAGRVKVGCLITVLVLVAAAYFGIEFFQVRLRYYRIQDEVKTQATFASALDDATIRQRLVAKADELGLPLGPRQWTIRRTRDNVNNRRMITIQAQYEDSVVVSLPGFRRVWRFTYQPSIVDHIY